MDIPSGDREEFRAILGEIGNTSMPFGRFGPKDFPPRGLPIMDLPEDYLAWFQQRGFPNGWLGELLEVVSKMSVWTASLIQYARCAAAGVAFANGKTCSWV